MMTVRAMVVAGCVLFCGCGGQPEKEQAATSTPSAAPAASGAPALTVEPLTVPAPAGASEPQVTTSSRGTILSGVEQSGTAATLKFAERTAANWSTPLAIASG